MIFPGRKVALLTQARFGLVLSLVAAALLRFWALPQGIPFGVQVDEPEVLLRAVRMMKTGDFNPHFFDYPTLYMYLQALVAVGRFLFGAMRGEWAGLAQAPPEAFYLWARAVTATLGTATVWVIYHTGLRWGRRVALLSAVMFAVMPLHVRESHFVLTDVPVTFFVMVTLLLSLRAHERSTLTAFAFAGAAAGLAGATKYTGVLALFLPLLTCALTPAIRPSRVAAAVIVVISMVGAFLVAAPYSLLDLPTFLNQFARLSGEYRAALGAPEPIWIIYLKHLRNAYGYPGSAIVVAGLAVGAWKTATGPDRFKWALLTLFPVLYFRFISNQHIFYGRYLLPLLPFLSLLGAAAVVAIVDVMRHARLPQAAKNVATVLLALIAIAPPSYTSIGFNANAAKVWTTEQAYDWILREIPPGSRVTMESRQILLPASYKATYLAQLRLHPFEHYVADGVDYLIASSQCYGPYLDPQNGGPGRFPIEYAEYMHIFNQTQELARFTPSDEHPGPEVRILKIVRASP
jgi:4-amino-4-deoxy-L-arabinose transferase-like glycosyltransferase